MLRLTSDWWSINLNKNEISFYTYTIVKKKSIIEKMEQWEFSVTAGENVPVTATLKESLAISGRVGDS